MTKIKVTKKKLNLDTRIRKSRSPRKKFEDSYKNLGFQEKKLNKGMTKIKIVEKIKQKYDKNQG